MKICPPYLNSYLLYIESLFKPKKYTVALLLNIIYPLLLMVADKQSRLFETMPTITVYLFYCFSYFLATIHVRYTIIYTINIARFRQVQLFYAIRRRCVRTKINMITQVIRTGTNEVCTIAKTQYVKLHAGMLLGSIHHRDLFLLEENSFQTVEEAFKQVFDNEIATVTIPHSTISFYNSFDLLN